VEQLQDLNLKESVSNHELKGPATVVAMVSNHGLKGPATITTTVSNHELKGPATIATMVQEPVITTAVAVMVDDVYQVPATKVDEN
jgi:hypothetical protein